MIYDRHDYNPNMPLPAWTHRPLVTGDNLPAETTGAVIVERPHVAFLLTACLPQPLLIFATGPDFPGPDAAMVADLGKRPFVLIGLETSSSLLWTSALPTATPAPLSMGWWDAHPEAEPRADTILRQWFYRAVGLRPGTFHRAEVPRP